MPLNWFGKHPSIGRSSLYPHIVTTTNQAFCPHASRRKKSFTGTPMKNADMATVERSGRVGKPSKKVNGAIKSP